MFYKNLYLFPGLGADERLFHNVVFPGGIKVHCIVYPPPPYNQSIEEYASVLATQITTTDNCFLCCSIGGILGIEVAKSVEVNQLILVSSVKNYQEIPLFFRLLKHLPLYEFIPIGLLKKVGGLGSKIGGRHQKEHLLILSTMLQETDAQLIKWGIKQICHWRNEEVPAPYVHLHGSWDLIFPFYKIKNAVSISKAAHFSLLLQFPKTITNVLLKNDSTDLSNI